MPFFEHSFILYACFPKDHTRFAGFQLYRTIILRLSFVESVLCFSDSFGCQLHPAHTRLRDPTAISNWLLEINHGGTIYIMETINLYKLGLSFSKKRLLTLTSTRLVSSIIHMCVVEMYSVPYNVTIPQCIHFPV